MTAWTTDGRYHRGPLRRVDGPGAVPLESQVGVAAPDAREYTH